MYDKGKIIAGLAIFVVAMTFPFWYRITSGESGARPELSKPKSTPCVESLEFMKAHHMGLLNEWRDAVVREGKRMYVSSTGKKVQMSLTNTCLGCHGDMKGFCQPCHDYAGVRPYCWDCHIKSPGETK